MTTVRIGKFVDLVNGFPFKSDSFVSEGEMPLVRIRDLLSTEFETFVPRASVPQHVLLRKNDVVVGMDGDFNVRLWDRGEAALNQRLCLLRARANCDPRYVAYVMPAELRAINELTPSTTVKHLSSNDVLSVKVPDLDLDSQRTISDYLDRETGEIDAMIGGLKELTHALQSRAAESTTRLVLGLRSSHASDGSDAHSPLSGIPDHWGRTKFGYDFVESTERNGDDPPGPLLSISEYRGVELNTRTEGQQASLDVSMYRVVRPRQLAANMMWLNHGGLGVSSVTGYISPDYKAFWISDCFEPRYVHHLFRCSRYIDYFAAIATGVRPNAQRVTKTVLDATPVPLPPLDEQIRIADELDAATTHVDAMLAKVADLKSLLLERRAALITDVVTGKKEVA
ncbi:MULTISPECIES: restriction endonuclease subunit S [unclassified Rathayibacter]|uniref:restriction endonuclease subunit S n=1 Tax=unclassified Rathayibacter TaxID=2609250 RepID=UPI0015E3E24C|nr:MULTISPECIES: restriction endonuclease subunit S [unclassified Rathayibacter]